MPGLVSRRSLTILAAYIAVVAAWSWFASTVAPSWIQAACAGAEPTVFGGAIRWFCGDRPASVVIDNWEITATAIGGGLALHAILTAAILRRTRDGGTAGAITASILIVASLAFLVATAIIGDIQDYHLYLDIWREVMAGHDPWYLVIGGPSGSFSLHAYGPLYNLLAPATLWNPLGPKLIFAAAYWAFAAGLALSAPRRGLPAWSGPALALWFAGPFAWVEVAGFGHFDVLVALLCVAAIEARAGDRWRASAAWAAAGVLLKYFPGVLAPFLALDRGRVRWRWLAAVAGLSASGMGLALAIWGPSALRPISLATGRESAGLSIFRTLRGSYSPIGRDDLFFSIDEYASPILLLGLFTAWRWARRTGLEPVAASVLAVAVTLSLYKVGFPQYYMVLYLLAPYWFVREYAALKNRGWLMAAYLATFLWISRYDLLMAKNLQGRADEWIGAATFPLMAGLVAAIAAAGRRSPPEEFSLPRTTPGSLPS